MTVFTLNIHHKGARGYEVPNIFRKLFFGVVAKMLFLKLDLPSEPGMVSMKLSMCINSRKVLRYQRSNQKPQIEGQTIQWPKEKGQNDKLICKTLHRKDRPTRIQRQTMGEPRCTGRVISSYSTCGIPRVTPVTNLVIGHEWGRTECWLWQTEHIRGHLYIITRWKIRHFL